MHHLSEQEWANANNALRAFVAGTPARCLQGNEQAHFDQRWTALVLAMDDKNLFADLLRAFPPD